METKYFRVELYLFLIGKINIWFQSSLSTKLKHKSITLWDVSLKLNDVVQDYNFYMQPL